MSHLLEKLKEQSRSLYAKNNKDLDQTEYSASSRMLIIYSDEHHTEISFSFLDDGTLEIPEGWNTFPPLYSDQMYACIIAFEPGKIIKCSAPTRIV